MRHFRSILYAVVLAPAAWVLTGVGLTSDLTGRGRDGFAVEAFTGVLLLVLAGTAYGILVLGPISPAGPLTAGFAYLGVALWAMTAPAAYASVWPPEVAKDGFDISRPGYGLAAVLAVPLICTALSARRWATYQPPVLPIIGTVGRFRGRAVAPGVPIAGVQTTMMGLPTDPDPTTVMRLPTGLANSEETTVRTGLGLVPDTGSDETTVTAKSSDDALVEALEREATLVGPRFSPGRTTTVVLSADESAVVSVLSVGGVPAWVVREDAPVVAGFGGDAAGAEEPTVLVPADAQADKSPDSDGRGVASGNGSAEAGSAAGGEELTEPLAGDRGAAGAGTDAGTEAAGDERTELIAADGGAGIEDEERTEPIAGDGDESTEPIAAEGDESTEPIAAEGDETTEPIAAEGDESTELIAAEGDETTEPIAAEGDESTEPIAAESDETTEPIAAEHTAAGDDRTAESVAAAGGGETAAARESDIAATEEVVPPADGDQGTDEAEGGERTQVIRLPLGDAGESTQVVRLPIGDAGESTQVVRLPVGDSGERTQVVRLPVRDESEQTRDLRAPGTGAGESTQVLHFPNRHLPGERTRDLSRLTGDVGGDETQVIRLPGKSVDDERTQVIRPGLVLPPGERTEVLQFRRPGVPGERTTDARPAATAAEPTEGAVSTAGAVST
ncbi:hypothetical protein, partial [Paractinoplanes rishiriensis]|uniref:hypothetical protein n=1 Tax=Paractinoplanes rishiriensis TaxID=1050105 RepID=UPI003F69193F